MIELVCLELSVLLLCSSISRARRHSRAASRPEISRQPARRGARPQGVYYGRATRALANYVENYGAFAAMDLGLIATGHTGGWGAAIWIVARIVYLPLYLGGIPVVRTLAWAS